MDSFRDDHRPNSGVRETRDRSVQPRHHVGTQHRVQVGDDLTKQFHGAVHTRKSTRDHRHSNLEESQIRAIFQNTLEIH
jgi:hypothetical protein